MNGPQLVALTVLGLLLLGILAWMWPRPHRAIWVLLALLPLHALAMTLVFHFLHPSRTAMTVFQAWKDVIILGVLARVVFAPGALRGRQLHAVDVAVGLFTVLALISIPLHHTLGLRSELLALRNDFLLAPFYAIGRLMTATPAVRRATLMVLASVGIAVTAVGLVERFWDPIPLLIRIELPQYLHFAYNFVFLSPYGLPYSYFQANFARRAGSVFLSAVGFAAAGSLTFAAGAGLLRSAPALAGRQGILATAALLAGISAPVLAAGRLNLGVTFVLLGATLFLTRQWKPVLAAGGALVALFAIFSLTIYKDSYEHIPPLHPTPAPITTAATGGPTTAGPVDSRPTQASITPLLAPGDQSVAEHIRSLRASVQIALHHPLGTGLGSAGLVALRNQGPPGEGQVFLVAVEQGIPGLGALGFLLLAGLITSFRAARAGPEPDFALATFLLLVIVTLSVPISEVFSDFFVVAAVFWSLGQLVTYGRATAPAEVRGRLRIVLDETCFRTAQAGVRRYTEGLRDGLRALAPQVELLEVAAPAPRYRTPDSPMRKLARHTLLLGWYQVWLPVLVLLRRANVLVCPEYYCPWVCPCPRVVVFHDTLFWDRPEYPRWWRALLWLNALGPARFGATVGTVSQSQVPRLANLLQRPPEEIQILPPAVAPQPEPDDPGSILAGLGLKPGYLLHVGAVERRKCLPLLVEAYSRSRNGTETWPPLVLAGPRSPIPALDDWDAVQEVIRAHDLESQVLLLGKVPEEALPALFAGATVYLFASRGEGFGIPLAEAMAAGNPVVATATPTTREVVGDAGLLAPPDDLDALSRAIATVVTDPAVRHDLAARGRERAERYARPAAELRLRHLLRLDI